MAKNVFGSFSCNNLPWLCLPGNRLIVNCLLVLGYLCFNFFYVDACVSNYGFRFHLIFLNFFSSFSFHMSFHEFLFVGVCFFFMCDLGHCLLL